MNDINSFTLPQQDLVHHYGLQKNKIKVDGFKFNLLCILFALATNGFGDTIFGINLGSNVTTIFIYIALLFQLITSNLRFPKILLTIFLYIILQTFVINYSTISFISSLKQFIGIVLFSISIFSFISVYRYRIVDIVRGYYTFTFILAIIAIIQLILFLLFGISIIPQNFISGSFTTGGVNEFNPEILDIFPRAISLSTEPAHYAILILPGVYLAILVLIDRGSEFGVQSKKGAWTILIGFILSFSLVGYFGLILCVISIFGGKLKGNFFIKGLLTLVFVGAFYFISQTNLSSKITSLPKMLSGINEYEYTSSDLTGFALVSNILVAKEGLLKSKYLGTGLNTHSETYTTSIYNQFSVSQVILELNKDDAGSLFIRLVSEFGIPGITCFIIFLFYYRLGNKTSNSVLKTINSLSLIILISYSARNGSYLSINFILFFAIYYYTYILVEIDSHLFK